MFCQGLTEVWKMVKQDAPRRTLSRSSKRGSNISNLKDLTLLDRSKSDSKAGNASGSPMVFPLGGEDGQRGFSDTVYLLAAAIFQTTHMERPAAHRLISFGKKTGGPMPEAKDGVTQRCAYELAFNALKCKPKVFLCVCMCVFVLAYFDFHFSFRSQAPPKKLHPSLSLCIQMMDLIWSEKQMANG